MKKLLGCLSMVALATVLASPVSAQVTTKVMAAVPFEFVVGGHILPAGEYLVSSDTAGILAVENLSSGAKIVILSNLIDGPGHRNEAFLTFNHYGSDYFLAEIWAGSVGQGRSIPKSSSERQRAGSAPVSKPEVVVVLARR